MTSVVYPPATRETGDRRRALAPAIHQALDAFSRQPDGRRLWAGLHSAGG